MTYLAYSLTGHYAKGFSSDASRGVVCHALTSEGADASEDGTGRGVPLVFDWYASKSQSLPVTVRRLLPVECERLQGLPDHWTLVPYRGKPAADGPRYRAIGNSFAVPPVRWIGERIQRVEDATPWLTPGGRKAP